MAPLRTRVEVADLPRPDQFRPVQHTVDTFAGAERPVIDNDMQRLGEALSHFGASLSLFSRRAGKVDKENDPRLADAYRIMSSANDPEFIKGLQEGKLPWQDVPHIRSLYEGDAGRRAGQAALNDFEVGVKAGTIPLVDEAGKPIDVQSVIRERSGSYMAFPTSPHFTKSFYGVLQSGIGSVTNAQQAKIAEINKERVQTLVKSAIEDVVHYAAQGRDDGFLAQELNRRTEMAWKVTGTRPSDTTALVIGRLQELAAQNPDAAERILKLDRGKGFDGQPLGRLIESAQYRKEVSEIVEKINDTRAKMLDVQEHNKAIDGAYELLQKGDGVGFNAITGRSYVNEFAKRDPTKDPNRSISKESIQDAALKRALENSNIAFRRQGLDPATSPEAARTKFQREYELFVPANRPHPEWQATLQTTGRILTNPVAASDPQNVQQVMNAYQLYNTLYARNPAYTTETLGIQERERKFYEQLRVYRDGLGDPDQEAVRKASEFVNNPPPPLTGEELKNLRDEADSIDFNGWAQGGRVKSWFGEAVQNQPDVRHQFIETAKAIAADRKVPVDKALEAAARVVQDRTVLFNGQVVPPNAFLTNESKPLFERRLGELFEQNKQVLKNTFDIDSASELSLREEGRGTGVFRVIGSDGQTIIIPQQRSDGTWDYSPLRVFSRDIDAIRVQARQETIQNIRRQQQDAADDAIINTPAGRLGGPSQDTREKALKRKLDRKYGDERPAPVLPNDGPF